MNTSVAAYTHIHDYSIDTSQNEKNTWRVITLTLVMMIAEIAGGMAFGSMSLLADGWHMGTHAAALGITAFAYWYARKHAKSSRFSFGTGKVGTLGGFASAIGLLCISALMIIESIYRFISPVEIHYNEAAIVAGIGLVVNIVSAFLLHGGDHDHHHGHSHGHNHMCKHDHEHSHDHNLKAAYLHVLADALTSVLAIIALMVGKYFGWAFLDPVIGIVGGLVITKWSLGLIKETSRVLLDSNVDQHTREHVIKHVEKDSTDRVTDLHIWNISESSMAVIISIVSNSPKTSDEYKALLEKFHHFKHITIEVNPV